MLADEGEEKRIETHFAGSAAFAISLLVFHQVPLEGHSPQYLP